MQNIAVVGFGFRSVGKLAFGTPHKGLVYLNPPVFPSDTFSLRLPPLLLSFSSSYTHYSVPAHIPPSPLAKIVNNADYVKRLYVITVIAITMLYESPVGAHNPTFYAIHTWLLMLQVFFHLSSLIAEKKAIKNEKKSEMLFFSIKLEKNMNLLVMFFFPMIIMIRLDR